MNVITSWLKNILFSHINKFLYVSILWASKSYALFKSSLPQPPGNLRSLPRAFLPTIEPLKSQCQTLLFCYQAVINWLMNQSIECSIYHFTKKNFPYQRFSWIVLFFLAYVCRTKVRLWQFSWNCEYFFELK